MISPPPQQNVFIHFPYLSYCIVICTALWNEYTTVERGSFIYVGHSEKWKRRPSMETLTHCLHLLILWSRCQKSCVLSYHLDILILVLAVLSLVSKLFSYCHRSSKDTFRNGRRHSCNIPSNISRGSGHSRFWTCSHSKPANGANQLYNQPFRWQRVHTFTH